MAQPRWVTEKLASLKGYVEEMPRSKGNADVIADTEDAGADETGGTKDDSELMSGTEGYAVDMPGDSGDAQLRTGTVGFVDGVVGTNDFDDGLAADRVVGTPYVDDGMAADGMYEPKGLAKRTTNTPANIAHKFNTYETKKTLISGLLDFGLLLSNASQLKALVDLGPDGQKYFWPNIVLVSLSIILQVVAGVLILMLGRKELKAEEKKRHVINDVTVGLVFAVMILNTFIAVFGMKLSGKGTE